MRLQQQIDQLQPMGRLMLAPGEYQGPGIFNHPVLVEGKNATIWARSWPVVQINSRGVVLKNLQIEFTGSQGTSAGQQQVAIATEERFGTIIDNVEVKGKVAGFGPESAVWDYPLSLNLGQLPHGQKLHFKIRLLVPVAVKLVSQVAGIQFEPSAIAAGLSEVNLKIDPLLPNTIICGSLLLISQFTRRIAVSGTVVHRLPAGKTASGQIIWAAKETIAPRVSASPQPAAQHQPPQPARQPIVQQPVVEISKLWPGLNRLGKGQRFDLASEQEAAKMTFALGWQARQNDPPEVDTAVFLLGKNERVSKDSDFVFYGNRLTDSVVLLGADREAEHHERERVAIDFAKLSPTHKRIVIALAIDQGRQRRQNFAQLAQVYIKAKDEGKGKDLFYLLLDNQAALEVTMIVAEIYRYKGRWRFAAVGAGYQDNLASLCRKYGLEVEE